MALSPTMQLYRNTKREYPDAIVLLRLGDFYEIFFEDAQEVATLLDLTLTSRGAGPDRIPNVRRATSCRTGLYRTFD